MTKMNLSWIVVSDLDEAIKFYEEVVGLKLTKKEELFGWAEMQGTEGGAYLGIAAGQGDDLKPGNNACITVTVSDIEAKRAQMAEKGAQIIGDVIEIPGHCKLQTLVDGDGNMMQLHQELEVSAVV